MLPWLMLAGVVLVLDQLSKLWLEGILLVERSIPVLPGFNLTLAYNEGAAFSFLADQSGWQRWFFTVLALAVSGVLLVLIKQRQPGERLEPFAYSLVLGGALGNVIDRVAYGHVIDFIDVYYKDYHWPAFNLADSAISLGVVLLLLHMLKGKSSATANAGE